MKTQPIRHQQSGARKVMYVVVSLVLATSSLSTTSANDDFSAWKQQQQQSFQEYKDKRDKEFTAFLKAQWVEMQLLKGFVRDTEPKPVVMPVAPAPVPEPVVSLPPAELPAPTPLPTPVATPVVVAPPFVPEPAPVLPAPTPVAKGQRINIDYFGTPLTLHFDTALHTRIAGRINSTTISDYWSAMSKADYDALLAQFSQYRTSLRLNDWGYVLLINKTAAVIYPAGQSEQMLFTWFMLAKSDYKARIAYDDRTVYLLVPSQQQLYSVPYFTFDKTRYYAVRFDGGDQKLGQVYTYDGNYPGTDKQFNMALTTDMVVSDREKRRKLVFDYNNKRYEIDAAYDDERIDFMRTYPQMDLSWYFSSSVSADTANSLLQQLSAQMQGMNEVQAVNFLLRFVQTSLRYKTDDAQFGKENYLFPEETLFYPYSDCEDRSILFAWLVRNLLKLDVVGLDYPGHVATAVHFKSDVAGDGVSYEGKRYVVTDPTFINASVGMAMPDFKNTNPGVIKIR